jgi:hypothetical protein
LFCLDNLYAGNGPIVPDSLPILDYSSTVQAFLPIVQHTKVIVACFTPHWKAIFISFEISNTSTTRSIAPSDMAKEQRVSYRDA